MEKKDCSKKWRIMPEKQTLCNILVFAVGFSLMVVYTNVIVKREISLMSQNSVSKRTKRSLQKRGANLDHGYWSEQSPESDLIAAHLTAKRGDNVRIQGDYQSPLRGDYFRWTSTGSNSFATIDIRDEAEGTMMYIHKSGFYFVYSQIRCNGQGLYPAGHKTVKIFNHVEKTLMTTMTTQQLGSAGNRHQDATRSPDSGYHAGIFFLSAGEKLAVKPLVYQSNGVYTVGNDASFFGLYFLHD